MKRCTKKYKVDDGYSQYWFNKLYNYVMSLFKGKPCVICGKVSEANCGHHLLKQRYYPAFRCDPKHIVPVCQSCHNPYAAHNPSGHANNEIMLHCFYQLVEKKCPEKYYYAMENRYSFEAVRMDYKELYDKLTKEAV